MEGYFCGPDIVVMSVGTGWYLVAFLWCGLCVGGGVWVSVCWCCMSILLDGDWVLGHCEFGVVCVVC